MQPTYDQTDLTSPAGSIPHWIDPVREADLVARRRTVHRTPETGWAEFIATARAAEFSRSWSGASSSTPSTCAAAPTPR